MAMDEKFKVQFTEKWKKYFNERPLFTQGG
jgi:hypothetical protein